MVVWPTILFQDLPINEPVQEQLQAMQFINTI